MDTLRERWTRVLITGALFMAATAIYLAWTLGRGESAYSLFDLVRGVPPPERAPVETVTTAEGPAISLDDVKLLWRLNEEYSRLIQAVIPSVVSIDTAKSVSVAHYQYDSNGTTRSSNQEYLRPALLGSGVIVTAEGHILTNHHVIADADVIRVTLPGGQTYTAQLIGTDPRSDVAVLKITGGVSQSFPSLALGNSDEVRVGEMVIAVGNPFGLSESVTQGIISAKERRLSDADTNYFQTDTVINSGSSGGPLLNLRGEIIGLNVHMYGGQNGLRIWQGVGLAIPSNEVRQAFLSLLNKGEPNRGYLGISVEDLLPELVLRLGLNSSQGALVIEVIPDSPAAHAGLKPNDIILTFNGEPVANTTDLIERVRAQAVGSTNTIGLLRDQRPHSLEVTMGERSTAIPLATSEQLPREGSPHRLISDALGVDVSGLSTADKERLGLNPQTPAVIVTNIRPGSPATNSLLPGDLIHGVNRQAIDSRNEFLEAINSIPLDRTSDLLISRNGLIAKFVLQP